MKLTNTQIEKLYQFTRQHYVEWYDVQTELVDHLANGIEQQWETKPNIPFDDALQNEFKKFGVFGFMELLEERTKSLNKKYFKLVWGMFKQFFRIPQILSVTTLFISIYLGFKFLPKSEWVYLFLGLAFFTVIIIRLFKLKKIKEQRFKKTQKKWLFEEQILSAGNIVSFSSLLIHIPIHTASDTYNIIMLFIITCFIVLDYIMIFVLPSKVDELLEKQYPEYNLLVKV